MDDHATWCVDLHTSNDQDLYDMWQERVDDLLDELDGDKDEACYRLAEDMRDWYEDVMDDFFDTSAASREPGLMIMDLIPSAGDINWSKIAKAQFDE
jgi:hypothetical protein